MFFCTKICYNIPRMDKDSKNRLYIAFTFAVLIVIAIGGWLSFKPKYDRYRELKAKDAANEEALVEADRLTAEINSRTDSLKRNPELEQDVAQGSGRYPPNVDVIDFGQTKRK